MDETVEINRMETVTMDVMPSTIAPSNLPMVKQISGPSSDPAPEDSPCCPSPGKQNMNPGHSLVVSCNTTFSNDTLRKDTIVIRIRIWGT